MEESAKKPSGQTGQVKSEENINDQNLELETPPEISPASAAVRDQFPDWQAYLINFFRRLWALIFTSAKEFLKDDCLNLAAQISYFALFSVFPLFLVLVIAISLLLPQDTIAQEKLIIQLTAGIPSNTIDLAGIMRASMKQISHSQPLFIAFSFLGLVWAGTGVFDSITNSLNKAWQTPDIKPRSIFQSLFIRLILFLFFILMLTASILFTLVFEALRGAGLTDPNFAFLIQNPLWDLVSFLIPWGLTITSFMVIYRVVPQRQVSWKDVWPGALIATILFELVKIGFTFYIGTFTNFNLTYGAISGVIVFIFWLYIISVVLLFGGEITSIWAEMRGHKKPKKLFRQGKGEEAPPSSQSANLSNP